MHSKYLRYSYLCLRGDHCAAGRSWRIQSNLTTIWSTFSFDDLWPLLILVPLFCLQNTLLGSWIRFLRSDLLITSQFRFIACVGVNEADDSHTPARSGSDVWWTGATYRRLSSSYLRDAPLKSRPTNSEQLMCRSKSCHRLSNEFLLHFN